jgi:hypothetical protein
MNYLSLYDLNRTTWKKWEQKADQSRRALTEQPITPEGPGTILRDIDSFLQFVGTDGIVTQSRNGAIPISRLMELNQRSCHPIQLNLKRPLLRDFPNLAGVFILLRVMDLLQIDGSRLAVDPKALNSWRTLTFTEQYFALLEALLFEADPGVLAAERSRQNEGRLEQVPVFLGRLTDRWRNFTDYDARYVLGPHGTLRPWHLFLQQQFGLIEVRPRQASEKDRRGGAAGGWMVGGARLTPWGTAVTWGLLEFVKSAEEFSDFMDSASAVPAYDLHQIDLLESAPTAEPNPPGTPPLELAGPAAAPSTDQDDLKEDSDEMADATPPPMTFGCLQAMFQGYRPDWRTVYSRPGPELRTGTHLFKASLSGWRGDPRIWRRIAAPADTSLDDLAWAILKAFKFDDDHMYDFQYRDRRGRNRTYWHPYGEERPFTTEITLAETELPIKDAMRFTFDYGDNWQFTVCLEAVEEGSSSLKKPKVVESAGKAPEQYPSAE